MHFSSCSPHVSSPVGSLKQQIHTLSHCAPFNAACWLRPCTSHPPPKTSLTSRAALPFVLLALRRRLPLGVFLPASTLKQVDARDETGNQFAAGGEQEAGLGFVRQKASTQNTAWY